MTDWKDEYAPVVRQYRVGPNDRLSENMFHHAHPHVPGRAHCSARLHLDMERLVTNVPEDGYYCNACKRWHDKARAQS